jgi:hypothetical protein
VRFANSSLEKKNRLSGRLLENKKIQKQRNVLCEKIPFNVLSFCGLGGNIIYDYVTLPWWPDLSWYNIPKRDKIYQMNTKYTKCQ